MDRIACLPISERTVWKSSVQRGMAQSILAL
jgi:hypothetical protein